MEITHKKKKKETHMDSVTEQIAHHMFKKQQQKQ